MTESEEKVSLTVQVPKSLATDLDRVAAAIDLPRAVVMRMAMVEGLPRVATRFGLEPAA